MAPLRQVGAPGEMSPPEPASALPTQLSRAGAGTEQGGAQESHGLPLH